MCSPRLMSFILINVRPIPLCFRGLYLLNVKSVWGGMETLINGAQWL